MNKIFGGLRVLPILLYCVIIYYVSAQSQPPVPDLGFTWQDKVYHLGGYGLFGILTQYALTIRSLSTRTLITATVTIGALYALSDEWHQSFVPGRSSEFADWCADVVGICLSLVVVLPIRFRSRRS